MGMGRGADERGIVAEINVTPFVDVMLVLLVIFMVTAPMMQQGVEVNLPKADTKGMSAQEDTVIVAVDKSVRIFIKADAGVPYGEVVRAMADIKGAGIERLGMVTEPSQK